jgi:3-hydroxybutyryl-CoA dehydrogenase
MKEPKIGFNSTIIILTKNYCQIFFSKLSDMEPKQKIADIGVVGMGLMGTSIITALLISGHKVVGVAGLPEDLVSASARVEHYLLESQKHGIANRKPEEYLKRFLLTEKFEDLAGCDLVMECVTENIEIKKSIYQKVENYIASTAILTTNTSAIPITILKDFVKYPNRFIGMHWAEPAFTTKFLEIVCSPATDITIAERLYEIATQWGKEPVLVRKDIRGFITNRIMYAMFREAFFLVENGYATVEDVDRSCRNDAGHWMTFCGLFRYMDITGLQAYYNVMKDLFPTLSNQTTVPDLIEKIAREGGTGLANGKGFYNYTKEEADEWTNAYEEFAFDISRLSKKYPINLVEKRIEAKDAVSTNV